MSAKRPNPMTIHVTAVAAVASSAHPAALAHVADEASTTVRPASSHTHGSMMKRASP